MPSVTVADTSCLILFYKIGELELLKKLFGNLYITETVLNEFNRPVPDWIKIEQSNSNLHEGLSGYLDPGEATSIALAKDYSDSLLIIDEIKGRKVAKEMGIAVTGSLGILITAKNKGHLKAVRPIINKIKKTNFRISKELIKRVLDRVNESYT